jgi:hypothetical protein
MPHNGETSSLFGVYRSLCCDAEIVISVGAVFPDCPNHTNLPTEWKRILDADPATHEANPNGRIKRLAQK